MKSNVDLTENMMFSRSISGNADRLIISSLIKGKYLWTKYFDEIKSDDDFSKQRYRIIATGNNAERAKVEEYRQMDSQDTCDCCGASLINIPWNRTYGVCKKCSDYYGWEKPRLWRFKEENQRVIFRSI